MNLVTVSAVQPKYLPTLGVLQPWFVATSSYIQLNSVRNIGSESLSVQASILGTPIYIRNAPNDAEPNEL